VTIAVQCPSCGQRFLLKDEFAGQCVACLCGFPLQISPGGAPQAPSSTGAPQQASSPFGSLSGAGTPSPFTRPATGGAPGRESKAVVTTAAIAGGGVLVLMLCAMTWMALFRRPALPSGDNTVASAPLPGGVASMPSSPQTDPLKTSPAPSAKSDGTTNTGGKRPDSTAPASKSPGKIADRPRPADPDRAVAVWLAGNENRLVAMPPAGFTNANQLTVINGPADIPAAEFRLREIRLKRISERERFAELQYLEKLESFAIGSADDEIIGCLPKVPLLRRVDIYGSQITQAAFAHLKSSPTLAELYLAGNAPLTKEAFEQVAEMAGLSALVIQEQEGLDDAALASIGRLTKLQFLIIGSRDITSAGLKHLTSLDRVLELKLNDTLAGDDGLAALGNLRSLQRLSCLKGRFNGTAFESFGDAKELRELHLSQVPITDEGLRHIGRLPALEELNLSEGLISDDGLRHLAKSPKLKRLGIGDCRAIGDDGIKHLGGLRSLERLDIRNTRVTREGADALRKMLPNCQIVP
jgi:Leucine-rich repeat (LRR) protein